MTTRITKNKVERLIKVLNIETGNPLEYTTYFVNNTRITNAGHYSLSAAYGGFKLVQNCVGGGERDISYGGYITLRELYGQLLMLLTKFEGKQ